ncbi:hypothetical protein D3C79_880640 [compost metagenome]
MDTPILWQTLFGNIEIGHNLYFIDQCWIVFSLQHIAFDHHSVNTDTHTATILISFDMNITALKLFGFVNEVI